MPDLCTQQTLQFHIRFDLREVNDDQRIEPAPGQIAGKRLNHRRTWAATSGKEIAAGRKASAASSRQPSRDRARRAKQDD
jgi:hypothetical protein